MEPYMGGIDATDDSSSHDWATSMLPTPLYKEWMDRRRSELDYTRTLQVKPMAYRTLITYS